MKENFDQFLASFIERINPDAAHNLTHYPGSFIMWVEDNKGASDQLTGELLAFFKQFDVVSNPPELHQLFSLMPESFKRLACDYAAADFRA